MAAQVETIGAVKFGGEGEGEVLQNHELENGPEASLRLCAGSGCTFGRAVTSKVSAGQQPHGSVGGWTDERTSDCSRRCVCTM